MTWTHSICGSCWRERNGRCEPNRVIDSPTEPCCFCGEATSAGIYIRHDPKELACRHAAPAACEVRDGDNHYSIGSALVPGLSKLIEEAGEVCQVAGKIIGAGGLVTHWDGSNLRESLEDEIADLVAACLFVGEVNALDKARITARVEAKKALFWQWQDEQVPLPRDGREGSTP